mgnify:FL=1
MIFYDYSGDDITMNDIPVEILLLIGLNDQETYRGMLAIPKFTRAITIGYRLNAMEKFGFDFVGYWTRNGFKNMGGNIPYQSTGWRITWKGNWVDRYLRLHICIDNVGCVFESELAIEFRNTVSWSNGARQFRKTSHLGITNDNIVVNIFRNGDMV